MNRKVLTGAHFKNPLKNCKEKPVLATISLLQVVSEDGFEE
jgi:hypothetical protein